MKKEIIAIDADDVIADTVPVFIDWLNKEYNTNFSHEEMNNQDYDLDYLKIDKETWSTVLDKFHDSEDYKKIKPIKGAKEALIKLKEKYELVIVTARPETLIIKTKEFMNKHFLKIFSKIYHTTSRKENKSLKKSEICKELGINTIIEDSYENGLDCAQSGIKAIILDMPWNRNKDYTQNNITYAKNWEEVSSILLH